MQVSFKLNDAVCVRLTKEGQKTFNEFYIKNSPHQKPPTTPSSNEWISLSLADLVEIFGTKVFDHKAPQQFVDDEIALAIQNDYAHF